MWLPLVHPLLGTWPTTQACALTGNQTGEPLVCRLALNPLSHTSQGEFFFKDEKEVIWFNCTRAAWMPYSIPNEGMASPYLVGPP